MALTFEQRRRIVLAGFGVTVAVFAAALFVWRQAVGRGLVWIFSDSLGAPGPNLEGYLFVFLISSMVAVLPLTIGGIGSREVTFMLGAQWLGLDLNLSIALSLLFYLITAFTSFWGIIYSIGPGVKLEE